MTRKALVLVPAACLSCALFVGFDDYDVSPDFVVAEAGATPEASTVGFRLEATPASLTLTRDQPATIVVRVVRQPGFTEPIVFDFPSAAGASLSTSDAGTSLDTLTASVVGAVGVATAQLTFRAHAATRAQSVDVRVNVRPASGDRDPAFADGGALLAEDGIPFGVVVDDSGRVIVAVVRSVPGGSEQVVHALSGAGSFDTAFGDGGSVLLLHFDNNGESPPEPGVLVNAPNGLVATSDMIVRRLQPNGALDGVFADAGARATTLHIPRIAADGPKLVMFGTDVAGNDNFAQRILARGPADPTFADAGVLDLGPYDMSSHIPLCARVVSGNLVLVLASTVQPVQASVLRFTSTGARDLGFGDAGGHAMPPMNVVGCAVDPDGGVVAGYEQQIIASRGTGDISFVAPFFSTITDVAADPSGRIIAVGDQNGFLGVARYLADGTPDTTFRAGGRPYGITLPFDGGNARIAIAPDGSILLAAPLSSAKTLAIVRLLP